MKRDVCIKQKKKYRVKKEYQAVLRLIASTMIYDTMKERKFYMIIYEPNIVEYPFYLLLSLLSLSLLSLCSMCVNNLNYLHKINENLIEYSIEN